MKICSAMTIFVIGCRIYLHLFYHIIPLIFKALITSLSEYFDSIYTYMDNVIINSESGYNKHYHYINVNNISSP